MFMFGLVHLVAFPGVWEERCDAANSIEVGSRPEIASRHCARVAMTIAGLVGFFTGSRAIA
jgi:hypothetical protein